MSEERIVKNIFKNTPERKHLVESQETEVFTRR